MKTSDIIIIGGGPAGYLAAERATEGGLKTVLFEKRNLGGVCLNEGCIPTKSLLNAAKIYAKAAHGDAYGISADGLKLDHAKVMSRKNQVVKALVSGVTTKMRAGGVEVIPAAAVIREKGGEGFVVTAEGENYTAKYLLIAAGSEPVLPPITGLAAGLETGYVYTSREILDIDHVPERLAIVGGGVIGLEMADYFSIAGAKVSVVEMLDKIAGPFDPEISTILQDNLKRNGVDFYLGSRVTEIASDRLIFEKDGAAQEINADAILLCIGRKPAADGLGLEAIGVYTERGAVVVDNAMQTNLPGLYAVGDINGKSMLAHTAYRESEVAVNNILGKKDRMVYDVIPSVIYTTPEAASVGETEETAQSKGYDFVVKKLPMAYSGRYLAENTKLDGICKVLVTRDTERILGVQLIGTYASEIILAAGAMIESGLPLASLQKIVFAHPTVGEIVREVIFS
jgi:dihydrolipoamide dehydrogenase